MQEILTISNYIITIGGAVIIILWVFVMILIINILLKVNSIVKDVREKYFLAMRLFLKPVMVLEKILNHFKNNR